MAKLRGCLHWEQGWEGARWWVFQREDFQREGGSWDLNGMIKLSECAGDHLTIYSPDNSVLWSGKLQIVTREGLMGLRSISDWDGGWHPAGLTMEQWRAWCEHQPPLVAELETERFS